MGRGHTDTQTDTQTYGHRDSMIESAQWADSMKKEKKLVLHHFKFFTA